MNIIILKLNGNQIVDLCTVFRCTSERFI